MIVIILRSVTDRPDQTTEKVTQNSMRARVKCRIRAEEEPAFRDIRQKSTNR